MLLLVIALAAQASPIYLSGVSGSEIATSCQAQKNNLVISACSSYALAVYDTLAMNGAICGRQGHTIDQIVAVAKKAFADHPESWDQPPAWIIQKAFKSAFSC